MSYLLDTNVVSELARQRPEPRVTRWLAEIPTESLFLSVITLGELRRGVERLPAGARREKLRRWLEQDLRAWLDSRLLPIDAKVADRWGRLLAAASRTPPAIDSLLAATALEHDLRLVTRNERDLDFPGLTVINPWRAT
jgi:predicted nucleic acid-binding protein